MNTFNTTRPLHRLLSLLGAMWLLSVGCKGGDSGLSLSKLSTLSLLAGPLGGAGYADDFGADARLSRPSAVVSDGANVYVADTYNHVIRKVVLATGQVTTVAGSAGDFGGADGVGAEARFFFPSGITCDGQNLYVADEYNHAIRKVVLGSGMVTTIAGKAGEPPDSTDGTGAAARFSYPVGIAIANGNTLAVAELEGNAIREVDVASGIVTTIAGSIREKGSNDGTGTAARFNGPEVLASDGHGSLFIADSGNFAVRRLNLTTRVVSTVTLTGGVVINRRFNGIAADGEGTLFIADTNKHRILKVVLDSNDPDSGTATILAGDEGQPPGSADGTGVTARFSFPRGLALDRAGSLLVADSENAEIRKVDLASGAVTTLAGAAGPDGRSDGTGTDARFSVPSALVSDNEGHLFVADSSNCDIRKVTIATGEVTTVAGAPDACEVVDGTGLAAHFGAPVGIAEDGQGSLFVVDSCTVRRVTIATGEVTTVAGAVDDSFGSVDGIGAGARFTFPHHVASDGMGRLFITDIFTIRQMVITTGEVTTLAGNSKEFGSNDGTGDGARFAGPYGITSDGRGTLFVTDNQTIRKVVVDTREVTTVVGAAGEVGYADGIGAAARFHTISGVASVGKGTLFISDQGNHVIRKFVVASGEVTTLAGNPAIGRIRPGPLPAELSFPTAVAVAPSGIAVLSGNSLLYIR
jgi:sugar lactone lactonase YvrE